MTAQAHTGRGGSEFEIDPVRGLPEMLPAGEHILWQGSPDWKVLAVRAFHARKAAIYFAAILGWRVLSGLIEGERIGAIASAIALLLPFAVAATGLLVLMGWLSSRAAIYTITSRRVVMRIGIALPITLNIPFRVIEQASRKIHPDGSGDIPLSLAAPNRLAFLVLWPHCRPWRTARPEPMLRCIPDAAPVADILARALADAAKATTVVAERAREAEFTPRTPQPFEAAVA